MFRKWTIALALGLMATALGATASAEPEVEDLASAFVGTWTFQAGSKITSPCSAEGVDLSAKAAEVTAGTAANEVIADVQGCKIPFVETDASHAKLKQSTRCTLTDGATTYNVNVTSANLSLASDGLLTVTAGGTVNTFFCSFSMNATALK